MNDVLKKYQNHSTVPKRDATLVLPDLGFQSEIITRSSNSCISKFYGFVYLKLPALCEERAEQAASRGGLLSRFLTCAGKFW